MTDVRLTATNPEDSSVVPVACNSRGELLVTEPVIEQIDNDVTINGGLKVTNVDAQEQDITWDFYPFDDPEQLIRRSNLFCINNTQGLVHHELRAGGQQIHRREDVIGNPKQLITNEKTYVLRAFIGDPATEIFYVNWLGEIHASNLEFQLEESNSSNYSEETGYTGPVLNVKEELLFLRAQVRALMEKLKMTPEDGWPVWD
jgi:hypothetical protein